LIDAGLDGGTGEVQRCGPKPAFTRLAKVLARPVAGHVAVRGRLWLPATAPCTAAIPETCFAVPVLSLHKPKADSWRGQVALLGYLAPNVQLACVGRMGALKCPLPLDGVEYGVTGELQPMDEGAMQLQVSSLCRFTRGK